ncbi:putative holin [Paracandidimonas soli]|uniref:Putative phage holin n=1 Tax=Paracandidimonas soli TaxID=1917182 RepID=A0A4R3UYB5_9BURK|nr:putative holin [Paracandidimonas soli]TCU96120.1 putative phage holin [Paracandidimonas soli]
MQTQATDAAVTAAIVGVLSALPIINGDALIGAFAGAAVFALSSTDSVMWRKFAYMALSLLLGYLLGPDITEFLPFRSVTAGSFIVSALIVTATVMVIDRVRTLDLADLISRIRRGG